MIATRFRSVGWVVAGTTAMLGCYLVTQRVAGERAQLVQIEHKLLQAKRDMRRLNTEIETRARMSQIDRWNREVLALSAARPSQYVSGAVELASFDQPPAPAAAAAPAELPAGVAQASYEAPAGAAASAPAAPRIVPATYIKPAGEKADAKLQRVALLDEDLGGKKSAQ